VIGNTILNRGKEKDSSKNYLDHVGIQNMARLPQELSLSKFSLEIEVSPNYKQNEVIEISLITSSGQRNLK